MVKSASGVSRQMLQAQQLAKRYGTHEAVRDFDLAIPAGRIVGLVGNNGAGKTTTIKMLSGLLEPTSGTVRVASEDPILAHVRAQIGYLPEDSPLYDDMTPLGYLAYFGALYGLKRGPSKERAKALLGRLRLEERHWTMSIGKLSKGSARKVALARCLLHDPTLVILDEPRSGLDPATQHVLDSFLLELRKEGKAILLSAHDLDQVERVCDEVLVMDHGNIVLRGSLAELHGQGGPMEYRIRATTKFPGSRDDGPDYVRHVSQWSEVESCLAAIRDADGRVLDIGSESPRLADVLQSLVESESG